MASLMMMATAGASLPLKPQSSNQSYYGLSSSQSETLGTGISLSFSTPYSSISLSTTASSSAVPFVYCGRGDRKTAKGKRFNHSFGNARPRDKKKGKGPPRIPVPASPPKKDSFGDDVEVVKIDIDESLG